MAGYPRTSERRITSILRVSVRGELEGAHVLSAYNLCGEQVEYSEKSLKLTGYFEKKKQK